MYFITTVDGDIGKLYTDINVATATIKQDRDNDDCIESIAIVNDAGDVICYVYESYNKPATIVRCVALTAEEQQAADEIAAAFDCNYTINGNASGS